MPLAHPNTLPFTTVSKGAVTFRTPETPQAMKTPEPSPLMTAAEVARLLSVTPKTLREWRLSKPMRGPAWLKTGEGETCAVRYSRESVAAWIESRTNPTRNQSQEGSK